MIVGIDEVGRGAWAGPLTVGAVLLGQAEIEGLTDSKKLSPKKREKLDREIRQRAVAIGLGWVSAKKIDEIGLSAALELAAQRAIMHIHAPYNQIIIDGTVNLLHALCAQTDVKSEDFKRFDNVITMKRADVLVPSVSAASIVAKVARDEYMKTMGLRFPGYGFEGHVGYGTAAHTAALAKLGPSPIHRMSFAPLAEVNHVLRIKNHAEDDAAPNDSYSMLRHSNTTTRGIGNSAEDAVTSYIVSHGYTLIDRNWKTKWCEIDIIAEKDGTVHFIEVKYRKTNWSGSGLSAITPKKLRQMKFAAELWLSRYDVQRAVLSAVDLTGDEFSITEFIEVI